MFYCSILETLVAILARWAHLRMAVSAVDRAIAAWLKREFLDLCAAIGTFPIALEHLAGSKSTAVVSSIVIVSHIERNRVDE